MMDVVQLLADDHERIRARFAAHERAAGGQQRRDIAALLWAELCVHTALERELISVVTRAPSGAVAPDVGLALEREHAAVEALTRRLRGLLGDCWPRVAPWSRTWPTCGPRRWTTAGARSSRCSRRCGGARASTGSAWAGSWRDGGRNSWRSWRRGPGDGRAGAAHGQDTKAPPGGDTMARGQGKPKQRGASGDARDVSSNLPGTKQDRDMEPTPFRERPGPRSTGGGRRQRRDGEPGPKPPARQSGSR
jgi:hypothetical protein